MSLQELKKQIRKDLKEDGFFLNDFALDVDSISTGIPELDEILGVGGFPRGRMIEVYGPESSGKTTLSKQVVAEAQKLGGTAVFVDMEHSFHRGYAHALGIKDDDSFLLYQPNDGEKALSVGEAAIGEADVIVIDSIASLVPRAELEGEMGDTHVGLQARLMSQACRKISPKLKKTKTIWIWTNQTRINIGQMFGDPTTTPGGKASRFYSDVRLSLYATTQTRGSEGVMVTIDVKKNKVAPPAKSCKVPLVYGKGFDPIPYIVDQAKKKEVIVSPHYTYEGEKIATNRDDAIQYVRNNPEFLAILKERLNAPSR